MGGEWIRAGAPKDPDPVETDYSSRRPPGCSRSDVRTNRYEPTRITTNMTMAMANSRYSEPPVNDSTAMAASAATPRAASTAIVVNMYRSNAPPSLVRSFKREYRRAVPRQSRSRTANPLGQQSPQRLLAQRGQDG